MGREKFQESNGFRRNLSVQNSGREIPENHSHVVLEVKGEDF
jgi:hypothetical protein